MDMEMSAPCAHVRARVREAIVAGGKVVLREVACEEGHLWVEKEMDGVTKVVKIKHG